MTALLVGIVACAWLISAGNSIIETGRNVGWGVALMVAGALPVILVCAALAIDSGRIGK